MLATLRRLYATTPGADVAQALGLPLRAVYWKAHQLGLKKTPETIARMTAEAMSNPNHRGHLSRFGPGFVPWNKGLKGSTGHHPNTVATQFKPGRKPQEARNYVPIGTLRVNKSDGLLQRKVSDDLTVAPTRRWKAEHCLVWEVANGPVPPGHIVVFKPGQHTSVAEHITPEKLECITRAENMRRNSYHTRTPELAKLYQLKGAITRQVNRITREQPTATHTGATP